MEPITCTGCHKNHQYFKKAFFWVIIFLAGALVRSIATSYTDVVSKEVRNHAELIDKLSEAQEATLEQLDILSFVAMLHWDEYYELVVREHMKKPKSIQGTPDQHAQVLQNMLTPEAKLEVINSQWDRYKPDETQN